MVLRTRYLLIIMLCNVICIKAYSNKFYNLINLYPTTTEASCVKDDFPLNKDKYREQKGSTSGSKETFRTIGRTTAVEYDPLQDFQMMINRALYGNNSDADTMVKSTTTNLDEEYDVDMVGHFPVGNLMRYFQQEKSILINSGELFQNKSGVHLPIPQFMHRGHCYLKLSYDFMQTAVNAFAIFIEGDLDDILRLPPHYVLRSARAISMMKMAREKYVATWTVVRGDLDPIDIPSQTLELYRPLFKYVSGSQISKLNLSDPKILLYIGTHTELNRHQVGVVASKYIRLNSNWKEPKYLNLLNNLLCGVPMTCMRRIPENTYLQLSNQVFFHIKACDPLQKRFFLAMMSRTQILGKPNSWTARDVNRLGLLLTEVDGIDLAKIRPTAFSALTAQVIKEMTSENLYHITKRQLEYLGTKSFNLVAKKIKSYLEEQTILNFGTSKTFSFLCFWIMALDLY